jgi:hypothetical protein
MMIDLLLATAQPTAIAKALIARGVAKTVDGVLVGTMFGFEYHRVPNPFMVSGTGTEEDPYVPNTMACYIVRLSHETEVDEIAGQSGVGEDESNFAKSKIVQWIKANGTQVTLTSADGWTKTAWRIPVNGDMVFMARTDHERLPQWQ